MSRALAPIRLPLSSAPSFAGVDGRVVAAGRTRRWLALDAFRFVAVCLMVQGHVFTTLLDRATKSQGWYPHHSFVHGYTAPMFLFGAGLAFGYTTFRQWEQHAAGGAPARKRYQRYFWLLFIGYLLHLPSLSLSRLLGISDPQTIARMFQADVLQHIGVSLALCQVLVWLVKRRGLFVAIIAALGIVSIAAAPWVWGLDLSDGLLPTWAAAYVNASTGSAFPLVPWAGFTYAGIVVAYALGAERRERLADVSQVAAWPLTALALGCLIVPIVLDRFGPFAWPSHNFWKVNPLFTLWRLGNVLAILALFCHVERILLRCGILGAEARGRGSKVAVRVSRWIKLIAAESLIIYVAHLLVLHGSVLAPGLKHGDVAHEHSLGLGGASVVALALFLAMVGLAKLWNELKRERFAFRVVQAAMLTCIGCLLLLR